MSRKAAIIMGFVFFCLRLALCVFILCLGKVKFIGIPGYVIAIIIGIGAFSDMVLCLGAWKKNIGAIWFWNIAQIFVGGILCCIMIPIVTMKAINEIKEEEEISKTPTLAPAKY